MLIFMKQSNLCVKFWNISHTSSIQVRSVQSLSRVRLFATPWTTAHQASLSITNPQSPPKLMAIDSVMPSNHLILCRPHLLLPSIFPSIRVLSNESALRIRWPKYWSFSFNISPSKLVSIKFYMLITNREMTIKRAFLQSWDFYNSRSKYNFLIKYPAVSNVKGLKQWSPGNFITKDKPPMKRGSF